MNFFDLDNLRQVANGRWLRRVDRSRAVEGVSIDTRELLDGRAFVAIRGERYDGHDYLADAVDGGASLVVVERAVPLDSVRIDVPVMQVDSTRRVLLRLASAYRQRLQGTRVIAVTGSSGKTTTRRLINAVLATRLRGTESPKSFNNDLGVPLTVLAASTTDKYLLVEIGMNAPGEIAELTAAVQPDIGVVTSVGLAHLGGLGTPEAIAREKASLLRHLRPGGLAVANIDNPILLEHLRGIEPLVTFGESESADLRVTARRAVSGGQEVEANGRFGFRLRLPGRHNAVNALAAVTVGRRMGLPDEAIAEGLAAAEAPAMRGTMQAVESGGGVLTVMNDAYNANPDSMAAGIDSFLEIAPERGGRRIVVLGDMLELGPESPALHARIGDRVAASSARIDRAVFVGPLMRHAADRAEQSLGPDRVVRLDRMDAPAARSIADMLRAGDTVLLKGSRGMAMERLLAAIPTPVSASQGHDGGAGA
ncbi:MAG: UDP-N-acetylmuramoyl-tripeptide--D-alanyl-D-alanine ligase [Phycisphaerales bacterium]|nr:UDP-N-acetylmuramoyl-tripeptide--D-alanyl-D-alanine ligase [Phycisphaerales bacterium]